MFSSLKFFKHGINIIIYPLISMSNEIYYLPISSLFTCVAGYCNSIIVLRYAFTSILSEYSGLQVLAIRKWIPTNRITIPTLSDALPLALPPSMNTDKEPCGRHYPDMSLFIPVGIKMVSSYGPRVSSPRIKGTFDAIAQSFYAGISS